MTKTISGHSATIEVRFYPSRTGKTTIYEGRFAGTTAWLRIRKAEFRSYVRAGAQVIA